MSSDLLAMGYGLCSAISWGSADFSGGWATRLGSIQSVTITSQAAGFIMLVLLGLALGEPLPGPGEMGWMDPVWGLLAGAAGAGGLVALYSGLSRGRMGVVAPLSAVMAATLPVVVHWLLGGGSTLLQILGFVVAGIAIWLLSGSGGTNGVRGWELKLALIAGTGFGLFFICVSRFEHGIIWPLVTARISSLSLLLIWAVLGRRRIVPGMAQLAPVILCGLLDTAGNAFFALASGLGRLDVAAVLSSLYPVATVILSSLVLRERITSRQWLGGGAAITALVLIGA